MPLATRLVHPHPRFRGRFVHVAPADGARGPGAGDVGRHLARLHRVADAALQRASPDGRVVAAAALVVALEPLAHLAEFFEVGGRTNAAAEIGKVEIRRVLLLGDAVVELPQLIMRSLNSSQYSSVPAGGSVAAHARSGRRGMAPSGGQALVNMPSTS